MKFKVAMFYFTKKGKLKVKWYPVPLPKSFFIKWVNRVKKDET